MLHNEINGLIKEAMKSKDVARLNVLKLLKARFLEVEHSDTPTIDEARESKILMKVESEWNDEAEQYLKSGKHEEQYNKTMNDLKILSEFLPKAVSEEDIKDCIDSIVAELDHSVSMKDMKGIMAEVRAKYPTADGKIISSYVKSLA